MRQAQLEQMVGSTECEEVIKDARGGDCGVVAEVEGFRFYIVWCEDATDTARGDYVLYDVPFFRGGEVVEDLV